MAIGNSKTVNAPTATAAATVAVNSAAAESPTASYSAHQDHHWDHHHPGERETPALGPLLQLMEPVFFSSIAPIQTN